MPRGNIRGDRHACPADAGGCRQMLEHATAGRYVHAVPLVSRRHR